MQTFLPFSDFKKSAESLDYRRLGKQRVECLQILAALADGPYQKKLMVPQQGPYGIWQSAPECEYKSFIKDDGQYPFGHVYRKTPWYNHPAAQMWKNYETYLVIYGRIFCKEWVSRGYKDTCYDKINAFYDKFKISVDRPTWLGNENLHLSHKSNLIRKDAVFYRKVFGDEIPNNLEYVWPK